MEAPFSFSFHLCSSRCILAIHFVFSFLSFFDSMQFVEAAKVEGHAQAPALAALGRYLELVENRPDAAQKCFKRALSIDPSVDVAGNRRASVDSVGQEE